MAFFDKLGDKLTQTSQSAVQKTKDVAETLRLSNLISEKERRCGELYREIGQRWYAQLDGEAPEPFRAFASELKSLEAELDRLRESVRQLKGLQVCPACGKEQPYGTAFCNGCGEKLPEPPPPAAERRCPACGLPVAPDMLFCTNCGMKMPEDGRTDADA